jgi:hypothetical protein
MGLQRYQQNPTSCVDKVVLLLLFLFAITHRAIATPPITNTSSSSTAVGGNGASSPGIPSRWLGSIAGAMINTGTGNKMTSIPLFGWQARGGMGVGFTLYHNSFGDLDQIITVLATWIRQSILNGDSVMIPIFPLILRAIILLCIGKMALLSPVQPLEMIITLRQGISIQSIKTALIQRGGTTLQKTKRSIVF